MSETGQLIPPYASRQVPQGNLNSLTDFIKGRFFLDTAMQQAELNERTRHSINQEQSYGDIDPFSLQKFETGQNTNTINMGDYGMRKTNFDQAQNFIQNFMQQAQNDPNLVNHPDAYTRMLARSGPSAQAATGLAGQFAGESETSRRAKELQMTNEAANERNTADNTAKLSAVRQELDARRLAGESEAQMRAKAVQTIIDGGDISDAMGFGLRADDILFAQDERRKKEETKANAARQAKLDEDYKKSQSRLAGEAAGIKGVELSPEQYQSVAKTKVDTLFDKLPPEQRMHGLARLAAGDPTANPRGRGFFGLDGVSDQQAKEALAIGKTAFGKDFDTLFQQVMEARKKQLQEQAYLRMIQENSGSGTTDPSAGMVGGY